MLDLPKIEIKADYTEEEKQILERIVKKNGRLRNSKPRVDKKDIISGKAAYVWRMLVFNVSPIRTHQCIPMMADFDLFSEKSPEKWDLNEARKISKKLDGFVDEILKTIPKELWAGIIAWGRAMGQF